jgi:hypothetical protein
VAEREGVFGGGWDAFGRLGDYDLSACPDPELFRPFFERRQDLVTLATKKKKRICAFENRLTYKCYAVPDRSRRHRRHWERETAALGRLDGDRAPRGYGYIRRARGRELTVVLCRDFVAGRGVSSIAPSQIPALAEMFASFHGRGVTTEDPNLGNLVEVDSAFWFIDFEWARVHRSPLWLAVKAGKDLAKTRRRILREDPDLWEGFSREYWRRAGGSRGCRMLSGLGVRWWGSRGGSR